MSAHEPVKNVALRIGEILDVVHGVVNSNFRIETKLVISANDLSEESDGSSMTVSTSRI